MSRALGWLNHLITWARAEVYEQQKLFDELEAQAVAASAGSSDNFEQTTSAIAASIEAQTKRRSRLDKILAGLSAELGVPASLLTLGSVSERVASSEEIDPTLAATLADLRRELRDTVARVARVNRRVAVAVGVQRQLVRDVLEMLLADEHGNPIETEGTLIDANA